MDSCFGSEDARNRAINPLRFLDLVWKDPGTSGFFSRISGMLAATWEQKKNPWGPRTS